MSRRFRGFARLRRVLENEGGFARTQQLELLTDLDFLLRRVLLQAENALSASLIFGSLGRVLFLELTDFTTLVEQSGNTLRPTQRYQPVYDNHTGDDQVAGPPGQRGNSQSMGERTEQSF